MLHGIIRVPVADLRSEPDSKSERITQALFGTPVEIRTLRKEYLRISLPDGCVGWVRIGHVHQVAFALWKKYADKPKLKVKASAARVMDDSNRAAPPYLLYYGTELAMAGSGEKARFELPGGLAGFVNARSLTAADDHYPQGVTGSLIAKTAKRFLGVPYLWGGISPAGFDCSGLVQTVYGFYGVRLPRNSADQQKAGFEVKREDLRAGDLLFFPGHVVISGGGYEIIHAAASRGMALVESLDPASLLYRADLDKEFICARRLPL